jgi:hypothetical protein
MAEDGKTRTVVTYDNMNSGGASSKLIGANRVKTDFTGAKDWW